YLYSLSLHDALPICFCFSQKIFCFINSTFSSYYFVKQIDGQKVRFFLITSNGKFISSPIRITTTIKTSDFIKQFYRCSVIHCLCNKMHMINWYVMWYGVTQHNYTLPWSVIIPNQSACYGFLRIPVLFDYFKGTFSLILLPSI